MASRPSRPAGRTTPVPPWSRCRVSGRSWFRLSLAATLPPDALLLPPDTFLPIVRSEPHPIISPAELSSFLGRPMIEVGRGRVALGEVDRRLNRLVVSLEVYRADRRERRLSRSESSDRPGGDDRRRRNAGGPLVARGEPSLRHGVTAVYPIQIGDRARMVVYGGTAQVAWLSGERLTTASVTSLTTTRPGRSQPRAPSPWRSIAAPDRECAAGFSGPILGAVGVAGDVGSSTIRGAFPITRQERRRWPHRRARPRFRRGTDADRLPSLVQALAADPRP